MRSDFLEDQVPFETIHYRTKEYIGRVCRDIIEDILKQTYDEENPVSSAPLKCNRGSQTDKVPVRFNYNLTVKQQIYEKFIRGKIEDILDNISTTINFTLVDLFKTKFQNEISCNSQKNVSVDMKELATNMEKLLIVSDKLVFLLKIVLFVLCLNVLLLVRSNLNEADLSLKIVKFSL